MASEVTMKRAAFIFFVLLLSLTILACDFAGITVDLWGDGDDNGAIEEPPASQPQNAPVEAGIDGPPDVSVLQMGPVKIAYHASSVVGIAVVELSIDGVVVSSIASPDATTKVVALSYSWNPPAPGSYILQVRAQNKNGEWSNFATSAVTIQGAQPTAQLPPQQAPREPLAPQPTNFPQPTDTPQPTTTPDKVTIYDVKFDKNMFYYGDGSCGSREITISAKVTRPEDVSGVFLFNRFFDNQGGGTSKWDSGHSMSKKSDGTYSITIASDKLANYNMYRYAVMNYQIVASGKTTDSTRLAVTEVFKNIQLNRCP